MADTSFTARVTTIAAAWLNVVNKLVYWGRKPGYATSTGSANAQVLTLETGSLYTTGTEADGDSFLFAAGFTNTAAATLQVKPSGGTNTARAIQQNGLALVGGEIQAGLVYQVVRLGTTWQLTNLSKVYGAIEPISSVAGTNTITGGLSAANQGYGTNAHYSMIPAATNTGATTVNLTPTGGAALGAKSVFWNGAALTGGEMRLGVPVILMYDGTQFNIVGNASAIPVGLINAKGDLLAGSAADAVAIKSAGADNSLLGYDSTQTTGLRTFTLAGTLAASAGVLTGGVAAQSDQEAGSSLVLATTPGRQQFHPSAIKAWVRFNSAVAVSASYNVTSVTDLGPGNWTVNFTVSFSGAGLYGAMANGGYVSGVTALAYHITAMATGSATILCLNTTTAAGTDPTSLDSIQLVAFGDQ